MKNSNTNDQEPASHPSEQVFAPAGEAMRRAARRAHLRAAKNGTPVAIYQDGKVIWVKADELLVK